MSFGVNDFKETVGAIAVNPGEIKEGREPRTKGTGGLEEEALADKSTGL